MRLCNALSFWAKHDPLFFFTTLGPLEGKEGEIDSFVSAMHAKGLSSAFIKPIEDHANINKEAEHGMLTREIFSEIPYISCDDANRMASQTTLFVDIYAKFYSGIWNYYQDKTCLDRSVQ